MPSFDRLASQTVSTKRNPAISGGKRGTATTLVATLACLPLDPVDPELRRRMALDTPHELLQTFAQGTLDIMEGDILVHKGVDYPIRSCAEWIDFHGGTFIHLILENLKG